jgi:hypothetical protein
LEKYLRIAVASLALACVLSPAYAEERAAATQYGLGDQTISISAGMFVPLFLLPTGIVLLSGSPPHLSVGAVGSLSWATYITPQVRVGVDLAGNFTLDPNSNVLLMLPLVFKASYILSLYPFEFPLTMGIGPNFLLYTGLTDLDLLLRPGVGFYWNYSSSWAFGANLNYWFDMQFTTDPTLTRYGNFLEFSLSALYHF